MNIYDAIETMRQLTRQQGSFSFSFMSYSATRGKSDGIINVEKARLRARPNTDQNRNAEIMEAYTDLNTGEAFQFYQPLLMMFNGQKVKLT
jgi:hypothetical protein